MFGLRKSVSYHHIRNNDDENHRRSSSLVDSTRAPHSRSSTDTFVIPRRTRYPSSASPQPAPLDLVVAENLLSYEPTDASKTVYERASANVSRVRVRNSAKLDLRDQRSSTAPSDQTDRPCRRRAKALSSHSSSDWNFFTRGLSIAESQGSNDHDASTHVKHYNRLAKQLHISEMSVLGEIGIFRRSP